MKRALSFLIPIVLLFLCFHSEAQVYIVTDDYFQGRHTKVNLEVLDSLSKEPIAFASVYLVAKGDTVITNFTLSDAKGKAELSDIPYGNYVLFAEFMGYKAYSKEYYFRRESENLGQILMQQDLQALEAARISDVANPIVVKKDTLEYNAAAFSTSRNATLGDLLEKMPGFEVGKDGSLKNNGVEVSKITVGGRTFFFDDKSVALSNIPAVVVDKVKVIDRKPESEQATDVESLSKERIVDIALKKEYEEGWFGNASLYGGVPLSGDDEQTIPPDRDALYNAHLLAAYYNKEDQLTVIANSMNAQAGNSGVVIFVNADNMGDAASVDLSALSSDLQASNQIGVNVNTTKIKGFNSTATVSFNDSNNDSASKSSRTTFRDDGDLDYSSYSSGESGKDAFNVKVELQKQDTKKTTLVIRPGLTYTDSRNFSSASSLTEGVGHSFVNSSSSNGYSRSDNISSTLFVSFGIKNLGKNARTLTLSDNLSFGSTKGDAKDYSVTTFETDLIRDLYYRNRSSSRSTSFTAAYVEPLAEKWRLQVDLGLTFSNSESTRDAFNRGDEVAGFTRTFDDRDRYNVANDYYSSFSDNTSRYINTRIRIQHRPSTAFVYQVGTNIFTRNVETVARNYGVESEVGKGDWTKGIAPYLYASLNKNNFSGFGTYSASLNQPSNSNLTPVVNVSDPTRISSGNIYLKPYTSHSSYFILQYNIPEKQIFLSSYMTASFTSNGISTTTWYDTKGTMYSVPVNADRPGGNIYCYAQFNVPVDSKKILRINGEVFNNFSSTTSYQRMSTPEPLDVDNVSYADFISEVWGKDPSGDDFYSGKTGFKRNVTKSNGLGFEFGVRAKWEKLDLSATYRYSPTKVHSSLYESYNADYSTSYINAGLKWQAPKDFEVNSDISYTYYSGRRTGYDHPSFIWGAEINKNIGAFTLMLIAKDILAQGKSFSHTANANYIEDRIRMSMGRYFMLGVKFNFGKMSPTQSSKAQTASLNML